MNLNKHEIRELRRERKKEERKEQEKKQQASGKRNKVFFYVIIALVIVGAGYGVMSIMSWTSTTGNGINFLDGTSNTLKGDPNAPVTIVEYSDFECPFCGKFFKDTYPQIEEQFIETGKAKLIFRQFPLVQTHSFAQKAAEASLCAGDQDKFWEMHDKLFENQNALDVNSLKAYAQGLGLDSSQFNACLDSGQKAGVIQNDILEGRNNGVTGTPYFLINRVSLNGAKPFNDFRILIENELAKANESKKSS